MSSYFCYSALETCHPKRREELLKDLMGQQPAVCGAGTLPKSPFFPAITLKQKLVIFSYSLNFIRVGTFCVFTNIVRDCKVLER